MDSYIYDNNICFMMKLYAFDFDGTLTTKDTLLEFIRYAKGNVSFFIGFVIYAPILILMKIRLYPNWKAKQKIFSYFFKGMDINKFDYICCRFAKDSKKLLCKKGMETINKCIKEGDKVVIVSASIDNWVAPFFYGLDVNILGTKIAVEDGKITGRFLTNNCYGQEKVNRIIEQYPNRGGYQLIAYGDSCGDKEMLEYADKGYYRTF